MHKRVLWVMMAVLLSPAVRAQPGLELVPIQPVRTLAVTPVPAPVVYSPAKPAASTLPFFDDFSTSLNQPDPALWVTGSGVLINNTLPVNQPTVNVATFDGVNARGVPYVFSGDGLAYGPTDTLTAQPIDVSTYTTADSVYLSFYWQQKGLGDLPDVEDSLRLQFRGPDGAWRTVWRQSGGVFGNNFVQQFVQVTPPYFHAAFQFRFQSFGKQSGSFDQWHIDYLYMNRGRSRFDRFIKDVACRQAVSPYLRRYTAMPLRQYLLNPAAETADSVTTDINNLFNNFNFTTFRFTVRDQVSGRLVQDSQQSSSALIPSLSSQRKSHKPTPLTSAPGRRAILRAKFDVLTTDDQNPSIPTINLRRNDSISGVTVLDNYYAFDDGSAENGLKINLGQSTVVMQFPATGSDTISAVRLCLVPNGENQTGQVFSVGIYANNGGFPGQALGQQAFPAMYGTERNGFIDYVFDRSVVVQDTFYVGYTQVSNDSYLSVGFDRNTPFTRQIFLRLGGSSSSRWEKNTTVQGALMLRPVMGGSTSSTLVTATPEAVSTALRVYPNPTRGQLSWDNPALSQIEVMDLSGRVLQSMPVSPSYRTATLNPSLPDGFYLLRLTAPAGTTVQKILLRK
ncbi:MAG: T9SS type A sorting domain-containing protein [Bacteroidetes bacterium]|nr:T9SS type A sorting domain-containing protein [Fibrella sp.]